MSDAIKDKYSGIFSDIPELGRICMSAAEKYGSGCIESITACVSAPTAWLFADHIISRAESMGIERLYFLSRDGYLPMKAAEYICSAKYRKIKISYLYVSRYALRMAAYHFHDESAYEKLFLPSYRMTAGTVMKRAGFSEEERQAVFRDIGAGYASENEMIDRKSFDILCERLRGSELFNDILDRRSLAAYEDITGYFRQEGADGYSRIGIIDIGWTGSMQAAMKRIFSGSGIDTDIVGWYMGFLAQPPDIKGCEYSAWLFGADDILKRAGFSHNIAECMFTAPCGMTKGYELSEGRYQPVTCPCENDINALKRLEDISCGIFSAAAESHCFDISEKTASETAYRLLTAVMNRPSRSEAEAFGIYRFCDDISEDYHMPAAERADRSAFSQELLFGRIRAKKNGGRRLYWYFGSLALSDIKHKGCFRSLYIFTEAAVLCAKKVLKWLHRYFR